MSRKFIQREIKGTVETVETVNEIDYPNNRTFEAAVKALVSSNASSDPSARFYASNKPVRARNINRNTRPEWN